MDLAGGVLVLPPIPRAPALARDHARRLGSTWSTELLDLVLLVVSEAVTNAVRYGHGHVELSIRVRRDRIRIEVSDANPHPPRDADLLTTWTTAAEASTCSMRSPTPGAHNLATPGRARRSGSS
jgi:Histidine kinase-like ATPase domain